MCVGLFFLSTSFLDARAVVSYSILKISKQFENTLSI